MLTVQEATDALRALLKKHTAFSEKGFDIDIESAADEWNDCLTAIGVRRAYGLMGTYLCEEYRGMYGREFLLGDRCVAYEIEYHVDAYMWAQGYPGYRRNITTFAFSREELVKHCRVVNISTDDVENLRQRTMFRYKKGIRDCYKGTADDPFYSRTHRRRYGATAG